MSEGATQGPGRFAVGAQSIFVVELAGGMVVRLANEAIVSVMDSAQRNVTHPRARAVKGTEGGG